MGACATPEAADVEGAAGAVVVDVEAAVVDDEVEGEGEGEGVEGAGGLADVLEDVCFNCFQLQIVSDPVLRLCSHNVY